MFKASVLCRVSKVVGHVQFLFKHCCPCQKSGPKGQDQVKGQGQNVRRQRAGGQRSGGQRSPEKLRAKTSVSGVKCQVEGQKVNVG